jgi:hypothetical protein
MNAEIHEVGSPQPADKHALDKRLESLGWGLFLVMVGGLWLMPEETLPEGTWLVGTGIIILGLAAVRYFNDIQVSGFWTALGVIALGIGIGDVLGLDIPVVPILLIIIGASILLKPLLRGKRSQSP